MRTTGSVTQTWPGTMPADSETCGPIIGPGADVDVALVDERGRREADHAAVTEGPEPAAAPGPRADGAELLDLVPTPGARPRRRPSAPGTRPGATACRGPDAVAARPASVTVRREDGARGDRDRRSSSRAAQRPPPLGARRRPGGVAGRAAVADQGAARPRRAQRRPRRGGPRRRRRPRLRPRRPRARSRRRRSPSRATTTSASTARRTGCRPGWRRSSRRGAPTASSATSPAGGWSGSTPTYSVSRSTTRGSRGAVTTDGPVLVFVHQPVGGDGDDEWVMAPAARAAFARAIAGADVRVVASGHRHRTTATGAPCGHPH